jgi:hypothetical protein
MLYAIIIQDGSQFRDMAEILGKFLFGYYVFRENLLSPGSISAMKKARHIVLPIALVYWVEKSMIHFGQLKLRQSRRASFALDDTHCGSYLFNPGGRKQILDAQNAVRSDRMAVATGNFRFFERYLN